MSKSLEQLTAFFQRDVCQRAMKPLRNGLRLAVYVDDEPFTLGKDEGVPFVTSGAPEKPEMTFRIPQDGLARLGATTTEDIGEIGVEILKVMANPDPKIRMKASVHIGLFDFLRSGYLGVLPLGGQSVMKFLATKGLSSLGKIKDAINSLRSER